MSALTETVWVRLRTEDDLPKKPGIHAYEHVDCLIFHEGEIKRRPWNCEHRCWDDEEGDDFFCAPFAPSHYAVVQGLAPYAAVDHIPAPQD